jgi:hypothetical protein
MERTDAHLLVVKCPRWIGCSAILAVSMVCLGSLAVYWMREAGGFGSLLLALAAAICTVLLALIIGFRSRLIFDAARREVRVEKWFCGLATSRYVVSVAAAGEVEVLSHTTQSEGKYGVRTTRWFKVRIGTVVVRDLLTDNDGQAEAREVAKRIGDFLGLPVVEKSDSKGAD